MELLTYSGRTLADIAAHLPGATGVFRAHKLDFCCGGGISLKEAAAKRGLAVEELEGELRALDTASVATVPANTADLIDHILTCYHAVHRVELPELIRLARRVEAVHRSHPEAPAGLADLLAETLQELDTHMQKEEMMLFPMMKQGGHPMIMHPIAVMQDEHEEHADRLRLIEALTNGGIVPEDACLTWQALYAGTRKLVGDVMEHIHLENNLLFPRWTGPGA
ncbi:iron-sulfur cluster repair protein YtfE [Ferrovibrio sp.]|uniref:iron-sulfur cluster repair protein YtfE n=1 Tax=Ferrovibrio sp. TaxID=1917215 RepID=UPI00262E4CC2|nr:iron-sulfur cluster repair protein YtfE [Ferrovibrio sp.]